MVQMSHWNGLTPVLQQWPMLMKGASKDLVIWDITEEQETDTHAELKKWFMDPTLHTSLLGETLACQ